MPKATVRELPHPANMGRAPTILAADCDAAMVSDGPTGNDVAMDLVVELRRLLGERYVLPGDRVPAGSLRDWTGAFGGPARALVRPGSTREVSDVLGLCGERGVPVVPRGGNTGLAGGAVPGPRDDPTPVILSTSRLTGVDVIGDRVLAGAGATLADVQHAAAGAGRYYGVDLAARDTATIGGTVATNAGGIRVCAFGTTRTQLLGIEAVLADGGIVGDLRGLAKDNTGYDLANLLCGSEGTLSVITKVLLRTHPAPGRSTTVAVAVPSLEAAAALAAAAVRPGFRLLAAEAVDCRGWRLGRELFGPAGLAPDSGYVTLFDVEDGGTSEGYLSSAFGKLDAVVASEPGDRARLWRVREAQSEVWAARGLVHKFDVSLPPGRMDDTVTDIRRSLAERGDVTDFGVFGHVADWNLHLEVLGPDRFAPGLGETVLGRVSGAGGSISAEHGLGRAKASFLPLSRTRAEIDAMRRIKAALDPKGILNPGVIFPANDPHP